MLKEISTDFQKIRQKHLTTKKQIQDIITDLSQAILTCEEKVKNISSSELPEETKKEEMTKEVDSTSDKIKGMNIEKNYNTIMNSFYGSLTKLGKIMKKDLERENIDDFHLYPYDKKLFYTIIVKDLYRRGDFKSADSFIKEANLTFDQDFRYIFKDLNLITRDLKNHNIETLKNWCIKYKTILGVNNSKLPFECTKLQYIILINNKDIPIGECVKFSKENFKPYLKNNFEEISKLMTLLIFRQNPISTCPYEQFNINDMWDKVREMFINDCCTILNLPNESGFYLSVLSGLIALPQILKAETILKKKKEIVSEQKELPYEIQLPNQLKFHSLFICPVTKEISTPENPPVLLSCGHCVSKNAFEKIQKLEGNVFQVKCPTCPQLTKSNDAQALSIF